MKRIIIFLFVIISGFLVSVFGESIPISTIEELQKIGNDPAYPLEGHYYLTQNIDASATAEWNDGNGFYPIGQRVWRKPELAFNGSFDGQGHIISGLVINLPEETNVGLFRNSGKGSLIQKLGLERVQVTGNKTMEEMLSTGIGTSGNVGGLVGFNEGTIVDCYVTGNVSGDIVVGILAGNNSGTISNSYARGEINIEWSDNIINASKVGGLVGTNYRGIIQNSYATTNILGIGLFGGLVAEGSGIVTGSFWDIETSGQTDSCGGKGLTTGQMQTVSIFQNAGWGNSAWVMNEGEYPRLNWENTGASSIPAPEPIPLAGSGTKSDPFLVKTAQEFILLSWYSEILDAYIELKSDLNLEEIPHYPIGDLGLFSGIFEGNGHVLKNITIDRPESDYIGVFSRLDSSGEIHDLGVENIFVSGKNHVGSLAGRNDGIISNCYATGSVTSIAEIIKHEFIGGLVGKNNGTILNSYAETEVTGKIKGAGGLVGNNRSSGTITNSYATGNVCGAARVGGLVGNNYGTINYSYALGTVSTFGETNLYWQTFEHLGGLVGNSSGAISNCYAMGDVYGICSISLGGLVGTMNRGTISNCYAMGNVKGKTLVSGLVGMNDGTIENSYATGAVTAINHSSGGLVASNHDMYASTFASYWNIETTGQAESDAGESRSTDEMIYPYSRNVYIDWDFDEIWSEDYDYSQNQGYPYLRSIDRKTITVYDMLSVHDWQIYR